MVIYKIDSIYNNSQKYKLSRNQFNKICMVLLAVTIGLYHVTLQYLIKWIYAMFTIEWLRNVTMSILSDQSKTQLQTKWNNRNKQIGQ